MTLENWGAARHAAAEGNATMYMHRLVLCFVLTISTIATPRPATAALPADVFDTVDSVEFNKSDADVAGRPPTLTVRGILAGVVREPQTRRYIFFNTGSAGQGDGSDAAMHCQRLAVLVMSKPGKFQFAIAGGSFNLGCRLTLVTP